jgi:hypothetical protein
VSTMDEKIRQVAETAVAGLTEQDRAARVAWCRETGEHGIRALVEGDAVVLTWGGRKLADVERAVLVDDGAELPAGEFVRGGVPDTIPEDWQ